MSVAKPLPHDAARLHVTGAARYVDDIPTPATTLHIAFGLSTVAAGTLNGMDLRDVAAAPGVVAVLTAADLPFDNDVSPSNHDEPLLATDAVHYAGQPVFMVIATTHLAARHAARLGAVDITPTTPILTIEEALAADARFEDGPRIYQKGDATAALATAPQTLSGTINIGGQEHFYLEGQAALALPQDNGDMVVHSSTQHPTEIQHKVAVALGTPMHAVRVETRRMGGGFGGKESQGNALAVACAVAAARTGRPCKMRYDRDDDMIVTGKRHDFRIDYTVGFDATGRISALDFTHYTRCGWAMDLSLPVADRAMLHADNAYHLDNIRITSHRLRTNTQSATAFRGFGGPQGIVGIERVMDHIAQSLGFDPLAVRRANFYVDVMQPDATGQAHDHRALPHDTEADLASRGAPPAPQESTPPQPTGLQTTPYHQPVQDCIINALTDDEHPCQILTDIFTFQERRGPIRGKVVTYVGDGGCNVPVSWVHAAAALDFELRIAAPSEFQPSAETLAKAAGNISCTQDIRAAVKGADMVYTDVWVSMGMEAEAEERLAKLAGYQINGGLMCLAKPDALVMHCLPAYRGKEIDAETFEAHADTIFTQAENRLHTQKAILAWLAG